MYVTVCGYVHMSTFPKEAQRDIGTHRVRITAKCQEPTPGP